MRPSRASAGGGGEGSGGEHTPPAEAPLPFKVCLIGGTGRSGTTILKRLFSEHPSAAFVPEWRFTIDPDGLADFYNTFCHAWSPFLFDVRVKRLRDLLRALGRDRFLERAYSYAMARTRIENWIPVRLGRQYAGIGIVRRCPHFLQYVDELVESLTEFSYAGQWNGTKFLEATHLSFAGRLNPTKLAAILGTFWRNVIRDTCQTQGVEYYVDDNPWNILWFDTLQTLLPEAKLVHIYRDPRDVVASYMHVRWAPQNAHQAARWYKEIMNRWFDVRATLAEGSFIEVALEDLVARPRPVIERISAFWGLPWDDCLLRTNLDGSQTGRWKEDFTPEEIQAVTGELKTELSALGYA